jgi:hypothetical protein
VPWGRVAATPEVAEALVRSHRDLAPPTVGDGTRWWGHTVLRQRFGPVTIFGVPWTELDLPDVEAFLEQADDEPLLWEAKGTQLDPNEVRRQVCGFANSHEGGFLILGASRAKGGGRSMD